MNVDRHIYKALAALDENKKVGVDSRMLTWLNDSVSPTGEGISHMQYLNFVMAKMRGDFKKNLIMVSRPIMKLAEQNTDRMVEVLKTTWIKTQRGAMLMDSGDIYVYDIIGSGNLGKPEDDLMELEQCTGLGFVARIDKHGIIASAAFISSRIDYEGDGNRKVMYDSPYTDLDDCIYDFGRFLVVLAFLQYADTQKVYIENGQKKKLPNDNETMRNATGMPIKYIDSKWVREIIRVEGFAVRGHFRFQPCGKGREDKKLIYISPYEKHGYHRKAQKDAV